jgi:hypothetical protein
MRVTCLHCGGPMAQKTGKQLYCSGKCKKAAFVARHAGDDNARLDAFGESQVLDLESAPRRLQVAKLFDLWDGGGNFEHVAPAQWMRPQDKRQGR